MDLFDALEGRDVERIKELLKDETLDLNNMRTGEPRFTPLMYAFHYNNDLNIIKLLLEKGSDVNARAEGGDVPLGYAVCFANDNDSIDKIKLLLKKGADINAKNGDGYTPLMIAANFSNTTSSIDIIKFLLDNGANILDKNNKGRSAADFCPTQECKDYLYDIIWKQLYHRDMNLALKYSRSGMIKLPKDIWEIILLNKRQQLLCSDLHSRRNIELLILFAMELGIPVTEKMTKGQLCGLISRQLSYGKYYNKNIIDEMNKHKSQILDIALKYNIDTSKPIKEIIKALSNVF